MIKLVEAKQVGRVSYMTDSINTIANIIEAQRIRSSRPEYNPKQRKNMQYVSLSRNMTSAANRNANRWKYGIIIDGDKLSNRYSIEPFSFAGNAIIKGDRFRLKTLTLYDDGICSMYLVNWGTKIISRQLYNKLEEIILNLPQDVKDLKKLTVKNGGARKVNGHKIEKQYYFNVKTGGFNITSEMLGNVSSELLKNQSIDEQEERIWTDKPSINISGTILGIILPGNEIKNKEEFETSKNENIQILRKVISKVNPNYEIIFY